MLVGGRHDPVRLALAFIVLFLTAIPSTSARHAVTCACLEVTTTWTSVSSMHIRVMLDCEASCDDLVGSGGQ